MNELMVRGNVMMHAQYGGVATPIAKGYINLLKIVLVLLVAVGLAACEGFGGKGGGKVHQPGGIGGGDGVIGQPGGYQSPDLPFPVGTIIAQNKTVYREFLGVTEDGLFIVHESYIKGDQKRTDPYHMMSLNELQTFMLEDAGKTKEQYTLLTESGVRIDGAYVQWYANGNMAISGFYDKGVPAKVWTFYYADNGKPQVQDTWVDGARNGTTKGWYQSGTLAGEGPKKDNIRQGKWTLWHANGKKMRDGEYVNDLEDGVWTYYYDNGAKQEAGPYTKGRRSGKWQWWTREGEMVREVEYDQEGNVVGSVSGGYGSGTIQGRKP